MHLKGAHSRVDIPSTNECTSQNLPSRKKRASSLSLLELLGFIHDRLFFIFCESICLTEWVAKVKLLVFPPTTVLLIILSRFYMNTEGWMAWKMSTVVTSRWNSCSSSLRINRARSTNHEEDNLILGKWRKTLKHGYMVEIMSGLLASSKIITLFLALEELESIVKNPTSSALDRSTTFFCHEP